MLTAPAAAAPTTVPTPASARGVRRRAVAAPRRPASEADVLAMPEHDYMNEAQLAFFKSRLEALRDDLLEKARLSTSDMRETEAAAPDLNDRATLEEEQALELRTRDRERKLLRKVGEALARIEAGSYGWCEETGEPIGVGRLIARPTATLTVEAQARRERLSRLYSD